MTFHAPTLTAITPALAGSASRRELLRRAGLAAGALTLGGLLGPAFHTTLTLAQDGDALDATGAFTDELDRAGSLDHATGVVQVDLEAIKDIVSRYLPGSDVDRAVETYRRHAELGFAVFGGPEEVQAGVGACLPWAAVEHLVGDGGRRLPAEAQYAIVADLGVLEARSPEEVREIILGRFPNVPAEIAQESGRGGALAVGTGAVAMAPSGVGSWLGAIFDIVTRVVKIFNDSLPTKPRKGIVACLKSAMVLTFWWGIRLCFDPDCTRELVEYLRLGSKALSSGEVITALMALGLSWWVGAIVAAAILVHVVSAILVADAMEAALLVTPTRGACMDLSWWLWGFGFPFSGARPNH